MAKKKTEQTDLYAQIAKETGGDLLSNIDSIKFFIDSGSLAFNYICCGRFLKGGIPSGRVTEIYGGNSTGKSLMAANILFGCQRIGGWSVLLDCENSSNGEFMAKTSHLDLSRVLRYTPTTLEEAFATIHAVANSIRAAEAASKGERKPIVIIYDSIASSPCKRELSETKLPLNYKAADWKRIVGRKEQPGERAKICSAEFRKLIPMMERMDISVVILNQTRDKIGVMYGSPKTTAGGGNALPFYASLRLEMATQKKIENKRLETFAGVNIRTKNVKNRTFKPFVTSEGIKLYFDSGVDPISGLLSCLVQSERVVQKSPGNYFVASDFLPEGVPEYKFKASKVENAMPVDVLLMCPKLIDAESKEEVEEYLNIYGAALTASQSGEYEEKGVKFDVEGNLVDEDGNPLTEEDSFDMDAEIEEPEEEAEE